MSAPVANVNILIVDSDHSQAELAMDLIKDVTRAQIDTTNSGERAIELVSRMPYQVVIADSAISDMDILSILERVKRVSPMTSVILTSSFASIEEAVKAVRLGADEYFKKPYNPEHFKLAVRTCMDRRALFTDDKAVSGLMLLLNACQLVSGYLEEEKIFETVTGYLRRETSSKGLALYCVTSQEKIRLNTAADLDADVVQVMVDSHNLLESLKDEKAPVAVIQKTSASPEVVVFQFRCVGDPKYMCVCIAPTWCTSLDEVTSRFRLLQAQIQMTARNIQNYRSVRGLLYLDEPTGLYNTRFLHLSVEKFFERWENTQKHAKERNEAIESAKGGFSILFLDVDKFKDVNDKHGHLVGTKLLYEMARIIKHCIRKTDLAFRYGGDEFVMLLDNAKIEVAQLIAERIRSEVENTVFLAREGLKIRLTVSIGVANCPEHATTKKEIIEAADNAMYTVKRTTRNKVYVAERKIA